MLTDGTRDPEIAGKRLLILGAGLWQVDYIRRARRLGAETWATDWSTNAVGRDEADHFEPVDLKNVDATLELARNSRVDGVFTAADIGVPTAAYVAERLGLPGPSLRLAEEATNKFAMRRRAQSIGLNCPHFERVCSSDDLHAGRALPALPVIVKPVDNCSSRGVRFVADATALEPAVDEAISASRCGQALVEQFLTGTEGSIEALVQHGSVTILGICDKTKSALPHRYDLELRYPGAYPPVVRRALHEFIQRLAGGFGVENGILHVEFLVSDVDQRVFLIEFALRGCGSKVITHLMPHLTGIDVVRVLLRQALGFDTHTEVMRHMHGALQFLIFPRGRITAVRGEADARLMRGVIDACVERQPGDTIEEVRDGRSRPGHVLVYGRTRDEVQDVLRAVRATIRIDYEGALGVAPLECAAV